MWYRYHGLSLACLSFCFCYPQKGPGWGGGGRGVRGGRSHHKFMNTNFAFHESQNKIVYLNSATCLGDLCMAITSLLKCEVTSKTQK